MRSKSTKFIIIATTSLFLSGCEMVVLRPSGDVASQQSDLLFFTTGLMLLLIVPVIAATLFIAWRYRASNTAVRYEPDWHHSTHLEVLIWTVPLLMIIVLGAVTWRYTHLLDPFRPLERINATQRVTEETQTLRVQVVALDWKWLFIYPDHGIATVNELAAPVDTPIHFELTSTSIMNAFYIPAMAGMIYAMPGMKTQLNAVINEEGKYNGLSSNYSGPGFSNMVFRFHGMSNEGFDAWVAKVKAEGEPLTRDRYLGIEKPSEREPVRYFQTVDPALFASVINLCADPSRMCADEMMFIDKRGGSGLNSASNYERLIYDAGRVHGTHFGHGPSGYAMPRDETAMPEDATSSPQPTE